jgi:integrase
MSGRARANGEGSIYPFRNGYAAYVWVTTPAGKRQRKYVYGKTREEVHEKWIRLQGESRRGPVAPKVPTVAAFLEYWLKEVIEPNRAPLTYATYESHARLHIIPALGKRRLDKLTIPEAQKWLNNLRKTCQCCAQGKDEKRPENRRKCCAVGKCCEDFPSDKSVSGVRAVLRSALTQAMTEELITRNVLMSVRLPSRRKRKTQEWTTEEARAFLESARSAGDPMYSAYVLIVVLGLRKGEVLGLVWNDVDFTKSELDIAHQLQRVRGTLYHRETKTEDSDDTLPLPPICVTALMERKAVQQRACKAAGDAWQGGNWVTTTRYGSPIEPRNFNRSFEARCAAAGVRRITVHDARRTCATLLVDLDVHPRVIMKILRHAQISITMEVYAKASSKATREALRRLGESLDDPPAA